MVSSLGIAPLYGLRSGVAPPTGGRFGSHARRSAPRQRASAGRARDDSPACTMRGVTATLACGTPDDGVSRPGTWIRSLPILGDLCPACTSSQVCAGTPVGTIWLAPQERAERRLLGRR